MDTSHRTKSQTDIRPGMAVVRGAGFIALMLVLLLSIAACGRGREESTPTTVPVAESPLIVPTVVTDTPESPETPGPADTPGTAESPLAAPTATATQNEVAAQGSAAVTATVDANGTTAVFTPLEVDEGIKCDIESHIDLAGYPNLEQELGCPTGEAQTDAVAINEFGEGPEFDRFMLWFSDDELIYVLFPDNTWKSYEDTWVEGDPTFSCNPLEGEAESPPLPRRGFGKLWCEEPEIQEIMGLIPREERLCQHSVTQPFAGGRLLACFEDATIRYFRIMDDNTWDVVVQ